MQYQKVKSVAKRVEVKGQKLDAIVGGTMKTISSIVGSTLGPGGQPVLIERQEHGLPAMVTKDGVTVFRALGFDDPIAQVVMEAARDASVRTASEAGDGPQPLWSKVLTPSGFVPMGDLRVGMDVCGTDGSVQKVVGIFPKGEKEIVKITFEGGQTVECCEDHLWTVATYPRGVVKTVPTKKMMEDFRSTTTNGSKRHKYFTPKTVVDFCQTANLPLDPYLVGVLLGDGSLCDSGSIELSLGDKKLPVIEKLVLPEGLSLNVSHVEKKHSYRVKIQGETNDGETIRNFVDAIGLRNRDSYTKCIPTSYLLSSVDNRKKLLQGLLDADGHVNTRGRFEFSTVSDQMAKDFMFLVRSLGKSVYYKLYGRKEGDGAYSKRPIHRFVELKGNKLGEKIVGIERTGKTTEMRCIKVSNPNELYITDDMIVTHNTTTATILSEAIFRRTKEFCKANPKVSPQRVVRKLHSVYRENIEPLVKKASIPVESGTEKGDILLRSVATISANGDTELADSVMKCFNLVGDDGNVTLLEVSGPSSYEVEQIDGYSVPVGFEESCAKYYPKFINDPGTQRCVLDNPAFIVYFGRVTDIQCCVRLLEQIGMEWQSNEGFAHNVVFVATGFSESVLAQLALNFAEPTTINVFPLLAPQSPVLNGQLEFMEDVAAVTGATLLDPMNNPLETAELDCLGLGSKQFEASRFRSLIIGHSDEDALLERVDQLKKRLDNPESQLEKRLVEERIGKLTGGIAKLKVIGASNGELREKRDRAEDAICAVRGAIKHGCLPGGGWMLMQLDKELEKLNDPIVNAVLRPALREPLRVLYTNAGMTLEEAEYTIDCMANDYRDTQMVWDALNNKWANAVPEGILDSTPAVLEAIRNSISIASLLGTLGGTVVFGRDPTLERQEAMETNNFLRQTGDINPADDRA